MAGGWGAAGWGAVAWGVATWAAEGVESDAQRGIAQRTAVIRAFGFTGWFRSDTSDHRGPGQVSDCNGGEAP